MRILAVTSFGPIPGIARDNDIIYQFYHELKKRHGDVEVVVVRPVFYTNWMMASLKKSWAKYYASRRLGEFEYLGIKVRIIPYLFISEHPLVYIPLSYFARATMQSAVASFTAGYDFDIIHAHRIRIDGCLAQHLSRIFNRPYVVSTQREADRFRNNLERSFARRILRDAATITSLSPYAAKKIFELGLSSKVVPFGISDTFFESQDKRTGVNATDGTLKCVSVCRLLELKNIDVVIDAVSRMQHPCSLRIIGDGPERSRLEARARSVSNAQIQFLGQCSASVIRDTLSESDVFIMPSAPETYGLVYAEAFACGLPIICAKDNGFDGYFVPGRHGFRVNPRDVGRLTDILEMLARDPRLLQQMSRECTNHAVNFSWQNSCRVFYETLTQIASSVVDA